VALAPVEQGLQHRAQLFTLLRQQVFGARRVLLIEPPLDDPGFLQPLQSGRQGVRADPGDGEDICSINAEGADNGYMMSTFSFPESVRAPYGDKALYD
jgi:hypothetical protein